MWFEKLTGFKETSPQQVREKLRIEDDKLISTVNGCEYTYGSMETPSLAELRDRVAAVRTGQGKLSLRAINADVQSLHINTDNAGALFQVASQFNLLEMISPDVTPEMGITGYENDHTQGPACAIAAGAGTIYRNYFAQVNGRLGQTATNQIDCLAELGQALGNHNGQLWEMKNGYALAYAQGLLDIGKRLDAASESDKDALRGLLRIGVQWHTQVTLGEAQHCVSQAYCSALPVAYSQHSADSWSAFAQLILQAAYEATICTAILNAQSSANNTVYLTLIGGGAFGNRREWIIAAIERALRLYKDYALDVVLVSRAGNAGVPALLPQFTQ